MAANIVRERVFSQRDLSALEPVLRTANEKVEAYQIRRMERNGFGEIEVYWTHTDQALALMGHVQKLTELRDAVDKVHALRRADQLAAKFRADDA